MALEIKEIAKPFQNFSYMMAVYNLMLLRRSLNHPFIVLNERVKLWTKVMSTKLSWLVKTEKALRSFKERIDSIDGIEGLYLKLREAHERAPSGYIADIRVVILDSNRKLEYQIYDAFGELLRTSRPLLFDLHVVKLRGRQLMEAIPTGFWRYEC